jgi:hypothetical protein
VAFDAEFLDCMPDTITLAPPTGYDDRGQATFGTAASFSCYIEPVQGEVVIRSAQNQERKAQWRIYIGSATAINPLSKLTLPAGFDPQTPPVFVVGRTTDGDGAHHTVLMVG